MEYKDYYKILGVSKSSTQAEIKKNFRKLAVKYHPDKNEGDALAEAKFKEVNEAYEVLGDPEKRKKYDELGANWKHYDQYKSQQGAEKDYRYAGDYSEFFGGGGGFSDFFNSFFGGGGYRGTRGAFDQENPFAGRRQQKPDTTANLHLSFQEGFYGVAKMVEINGSRIRLNIKPGAVEGQKLKVAGKGRAGGDLIITLSIGKDPAYEMDGINLIKQITVSLYTAVLGGKIEMQTLHGPVKLNITKGTPNGKKLRLKGKGYPLYGKQGVYGDLIAVINVEMPRNLSPEQESLFRKIKELDGAA